VKLEAGTLPASAGLALRVGDLADGKLVPQARLGAQVQTMGVTGVIPEAGLSLSYVTHVERLGDGTTITLRRPRITLAGSDVDDIAWVSPRLAPDLHGVGLLERVSLSRLAELADPDDLDGDGISGAIAMAQYGDQDIEPRRFGWKADEPDLMRQISAAFHFDLGLATTMEPALWGDCTAAEADCRAAPHGAAAGEVEVRDDLVGLIAAYLRDLPPPGAKALNGAGARLFADIGCASCHVAEQPETLASGEGIWFAPYSDLLTHDLGDGLADRASDDSVSRAPDAREWRTAPLWGLGARVAHSSGANLLHDGRARSVLEAILWHDGEGRAARDRAAAMSAEERAALIAFLESL
jgi:CxxC motif-containing protein (DUF1111 family)